MRTAKVTTQTLKAAMIKNVRNGRNGQISTCVQQLVEPDFRVRFKIKKNKISSLFKYLLSKSREFNRLKIF